MATRALICRADGACTYHHWDGYPDGLGATLREAFRGAADWRPLAKYLIDDRPAGWSTIVDRNLDLPPIPQSATSIGVDDLAPICYDDETITPWSLDANHGGAEYAYIVDPVGHTVECRERDYDAYHDRPTRWRHHSWIIGANNAYNSRVTPAHYVVTRRQLAPYDPVDDTDRTSSDDPILHRVGPFAVIGNAIDRLKSIARSYADVTALTGSFCQTVIDSDHYIFLLIDGLEIVYAQIETVYANPSDQT